MQRRTDLDKLAAALGGLPVIGAWPGSPAAREGLRYGDVLLSVNGRPVPDWVAYLRARQLDATAMRVVIFRDGAQFELVLAFDHRGPLDPAQILAELIAERVLPHAPDLAPRRPPTEPS
ncbi:MAG TPA: PDZ domain-containing protein [Kofleriaceae bacterium]|jgi:S1-C subfamily serine protease